MWHMFPVLIADNDLIGLYSIICFSLKAIVAKCCSGLRKLVKFVGQTVVDDVYGMESTVSEPALGIFKECESLMPDRLSSIVLYMSSNKSRILGIKGEIKIAQIEQLWSWLVLHPDAVIEGFVHPSSGILLCVTSS